MARYLCVLSVLAASSISLAADSSKPFTLVIMDPMSKELACDCVEGYAQRNYHKLAELLEKQLGRKVKIAFAEHLETALKKETEGKADLIIGKHSVVLHHAKGISLKVTPVAAMTDKQGVTTQTGLLVVRTDDKVKGVEDLKGYQIYFGPEDCDEKNKAIKELLEAAKIEIPKKLEIKASCSKAVTAMVEMPKDEKIVAVISSYAEPLLEGCGTVEKGDLRVVGVTAPVPFITAFMTDSVSEADRGIVMKTLLSIGGDAEMCKVLETKKGFVEFESAKKK